MNTSSTKIPLVRQMAIVLALLVLILSLSLTIQPVRALASQILGQMGIFTFTNETAIPDEWIGQENFKNNGEATPMPVENLQGLSAEEAEQQAGFVLYTPTYVPACFTLNSRQVLFGQGAPIVSTTYHCPGESSYDAVFLYMSQTPMQDENKTNFAIGDAQPVEIRLRGQTGVWIHQAPIGVQSNREGKTELMPVNILAWEEGGFFFQLQSNQLSQDEMLRVAESLE